MSAPTKPSIVDPDSAPEIGSGLFLLLLVAAAVAGFLLAALVIWMKQ